MDHVPPGLDGLVGHWTVLDDERKLIAGNAEQLARPGGSYERA
jgi:hypothetical protein